MTTFAILIAFMLNMSTQSFTATTIGQYYEVVNVQYDVQTNTTYGVFARYAVDAQGHKEAYHSQLRNLPGKVTKADLIKAAPHDSNIVLIGE